MAKKTKKKIDPRDPWFTLVKGQMKFRENLDQALLSLGMAVLADGEGSFHYHVVGQPKSEPFPSWHEAFTEMIKSIDGRAVKGVT